MAGERKGEAFEVLTYLALEQLGYTLGETLFWGEKPEGFSIDPDFVLGALEKPTHWFLVTSTGSAKNFDMKFWRNMGELFEAKRGFEIPPRVINLVLEAKQKQGLQDAIATVCDADICVEQKSYGQTLLDFADTHLNTLPAQRNAKVSYFTKALGTNKEVQKAFAHYCKDLKEALTQQKESLADLWKLLRREKRPVPRQPRTTYVRRGIAKLMIFPEDVRAKIYEAVKNDSPLELPDYAHTLNFAQRTIAGSRLKDKEMLNVLEHLTPETIEQVIEKSPQREMMRWIDPLRHLANIELFLDYLQKHFDELVTPKGMLKHLQQLHQNPYAGLDKNKVAGELRTVWLFYFLFDLQKAHSGKRQGFGLAELGKMAQTFMTTDEYPANHFLWAGGMGLPRYANRQPVELPNEVVVAGAAVLANLLKTLELSGLAKAGKDVEAMVIASNLEQKLIPYRMFEPIPLLLEVALKGAGLSYSRIKAHPSFMGEYMGESNKVATTPVIKVGKTLLHWKSAHGSHCNDKTKELSGRAQALRFTYRNGKFVHRPGVERLILILDGDFREKHLRALLEAGWDEIYYPDELDLLVAKLKSLSG